MDDKDEDERLLQCVMCDCTTIEDYLKRHIRYNHLINKDEIIEILYQLHYPSEKTSIGTQTDDTWVKEDNNRRRNKSKDWDGGGWEDGTEDFSEEEDEVLCPACGDADDRTSMIACDLCDKWSVLVLSFIWCFS